MRSIRGDPSPPWLQIQLILKTNQTLPYPNYHVYLLTLGDVMDPKKSLKNYRYCPTYTLKTINYCFRNRIGIKARNYLKIIEMNWHEDNFISFCFNSIQFWNKIIELNWLSKKIVMELTATIWCMTLNCRRLIFVRCFPFLIVVFRTSKVLPVFYIGGFRWPSFRLSPLHKTHLSLLPKVYD